MRMHRQMAFLGGGRVGRCDCGTEHVPKFGHSTSMSTANISEHCTLLQPSPTGLESHTILSLILVNPSSERCADSGLVGLAVLQQQLTD